MNTLTEKIEEIKKLKDDIINSLQCIDKSKLTTARLEVLIRSIEMLNNIQILGIKQMEQNTRLLETLSETVKALEDKSNRQYKFY